MKHWLKHPVLYGSVEVDGEYEVGRDDEGLGKQLQTGVDGSGHTSFKARGTFRLEQSGEGVFPGDIEYTGEIDGPACVTSSHSMTITRKFTTEISCTGAIADGKVKLTVNPEQRRYWLEIKGHMSSCRGREEEPHPTELGSVKERSLDGKRERFHVRVHDWLPLPERSPPINGSSPVSVNLDHALTSLGEPQTKRNLVDRSRAGTGRYESGVEVHRHKGSQGCARRLHRSGSWGEWHCCRKDRAFGRSLALLGGAGGSAIG